MAEDAWPFALPAFAKDEGPAIRAHELLSPMV
jgi:hypothetical protein